MEWKLIKFEELTTKELYAIMKERVSIFVVEQQCPYHELDDYDQAAYHLFKENEGEIIAYARVLRHNIIYKEATIGRIIVKKEFRGSGLGRELLERAIEFLETELDEKVIKIQAQSYLKEFYSSFGFEPISEIYLEDKIPHLDMKKGGLIVNC
ncbi:GNAT family N-acetyltransferase [Bacillus sp. FJAT-45350]|uniref:GNAT family N-acetyltransferase n=1 Tax=Bacillus sp. FJAT-45350 TaxID=2011014 RepID=UPI000BB93C9B|nr:GNAT family N-acetyltransferase [Bacillus sp. FJAT-45350]